MIRDGLRRNAHPDMVDAVQDYTEQSFSAVADYMSRLPGTPVDAGN